LLDNNNNVIVESHESLQALNFMKKLMVNQWAPRSVLSYQEMHSLDVFQQGRAIFMRNWPYAWNTLQAPGSKLRGKIGIAPMIHASGKISAAALGGWGFGISSRSRHPEEAWACGGLTPTVALSPSAAPKSACSAG
jgi:trehalose/maltose transport system substrate-binding protein